MEHIVIIGGGIIGCCTAYYLLHDPSFDPSKCTVTLIEELEVAAGASGAAGGFLALDWHGPATSSLADLSFKLHLKLAGRHNGQQRWGFRKVKSVGISCYERKSQTTCTHPTEENPALAFSAMRETPKASDSLYEDWLDRADEQSFLSEESTTAQVEPKQFTQAMFDMARSKGLQYLQGKPVRLHCDEGGQPLRQISVRRTGGEELLLPCTKLLLSAGPWTKALGIALGLERSLPIGYLPGFSVLLKASIPIPATSVFSTIHASAKNRKEITQSPELFPRPNDTVYIAGENPQIAFPSSVTEVSNIDRAKGTSRLLKAATYISSHLDTINGDAKIVREALCFRPTTLDGAPIIDKVQEGIFVCCGHGPWGITLAPGSGAVMADLLLRGCTEAADINGLTLSRFER